MAIDYVGEVEKTISFMEKRVSEEERFKKNHLKYLARCKFSLIDEEEHVRRMAKENDIRLYDFIEISCKLLNGFFETYTVCHEMPPSVQEITFEEKQPTVTYRLKGHKYRLHSVAFVLHDAVQDYSRANPSGSLI